MQTTTAGHLSSNGGIGGHSAGDFYPYRVMVKGLLSNLQYIITAPDGSYISSWKTSKSACSMALIFKEMDDIGC